MSPDGQHHVLSQRELGAGREGPVGLQELLEQFGSSPVQLGQEVGVPGWQLLLQLLAHLLDSGQSDNLIF